MARSSRFSCLIQIWLGSLEKASLRISEKDMARWRAFAARIEFFWIMVYWVPVHAISERRALALCPRQASFGVREQPEEMLANSRVWICLKSGSE